MQFLVILIILLPSVAIATSAIDEQSSSKQPSVAVMVRVVQLNLPNLKRSVRAPCVHQPCRTPFRAGGSKPEHYNYNYNCKNNDLYTLTCLMIQLREAVQTKSDKLSPDRRNLTKLVKP
ncbi:hypothetical protein pipiens_001085 [Culex pipiens pipiens]|uniref:Secreted protein n=1 Tax=Culex pipiens pipiens TaxID=38569 RepID=A0ABD1CLC5_CULPP